MKAMVIATLALVVATAAPALANAEDVANDISEHVMSPYCPGVTLHDCPSDRAVELRDKIKDRAEEGFTRAQIMSELEAEFGPTIRAEPPRSGIGLLAWILPLFAGLGAATFAWTILRKWARPPDRPEDYDPDVHVTTEDRRRLDAELAKMRGPA
ncbi:MAG: cytochrome c-type biosis protein CcmH [Actinomycetota bacterium]|jgi:cytochrome c-type biogenesis protein CcmH/NrfF|nr:cytochrome c-type biosis protein CcmH [Actinomycetota bacterium]